ncbi:hypothetical protein VPHK460_0063 [Vibrio phage K460]
MYSRGFVTPSSFSDELLKVLPLRIDYIFTFSFTCKGCIFPKEGISTFTVINLRGMPVLSGLTSR